MFIQQNWKIIVVFIIIYSLIILKSSNFIISPIASLIEDSYQISKNTSTSLGIGVLSVLPTDRINRQFQIWGKKFQEMSNPDSFFICVSNCSDFSGYPCRSIPPEYLKLIADHQKSLWRGDFDRSVKRAILLRELYKNKDLDWMIVTCDDVMVHVDKIPKMIEVFNKLGDPRTTAIVKSHCIDESSAASGRKTYAQGGSGSLFSRKAAELLIQHMDEWVSTVDTHDDVHFSKWVEMIGMKPTAMSSGFFIGHDIQWRESSVIHSKSWSELPTCPPKAATKYCDSDLYPLNQVMVWHQSQMTRAQNIYQDTKTDDIPDNVRIYTVGGTPHMCQVR